MMQLQLARTVPLALGFLLLGSPVVAQSSSATSTATSTPTSGATTSTASNAASSSSTGSATSSQPVTHTVSVGYAGFTFQPDVTLANVGDTIEFDFYPQNHSVARAEYSYPCIPYEDTGVDKIGFFSGFQPVDAILSTPPSYSIKVNDSDPIFFYCTAPGSCINYGMVGVINPTANETLLRQKQLAKEATFMLQPGEPWPSESTPDPFTTTSTTPSATASTTGSAPSSAATAATVHHHSGLSGGAIAGIVVGAVAGLALIGGLFYLCGRNQALTDVLHGRNNHNQPPLQPSMVDNRQSVLSGTTAYTSQPKHMSQMTGMNRPESEMHFSPNGPGSPGLPQYPMMHHGDRSPSLRGQFDMMSPASTEHPGSPGSPGLAPAYSPMPSELPQEERGPHEMPASEGVWQDDPRKQGAPDRYV